MRLIFLILVSLVLVSCVEDRQIDVTPKEPLSIAGPLYLLESGYGSNTKEGGEGEYDDPWDTIEDGFGVETNHTGVVKDGGDAHDDPWNTIRDASGGGSALCGGSKEGGDDHDDPWNTIREIFGADSVHKRGPGSGKAGTAPLAWFGEEGAGKSAGKPGREKVGEDDDDPWSTITDKFPVESTHTFAADDPGGKERILYPVGCFSMKYMMRPAGAIAADDGQGSLDVGDTRFPQAQSSLSSAEVSWVTPVAELERVKFVLFDGPAEAARGSGFVTEIRGDIALVSLASGYSLFVVHRPADWIVGTRVDCGKLDREIDAFIFRGAKTEGHPWDVLAECMCEGSTVKG